MALESYVLSGQIFRGDAETAVGQLSVASGTDLAGARREGGQSSVASRTDLAGAPPERAQSPVGRSGPAAGTGGTGTGPAVGLGGSWMKPRRGAGRVTFRWRVQRDVARAWRALERLHARSPLPGSFVELLCVSLWRSWQHTLGPQVAYGDIYPRERYRCSSPVCPSRNQTPHHIRFRSQGGDDRPENLTGPCLCCHLDGIHQGNIRATGPASELQWLFGRQPILEVRGRVRRQLSLERAGTADAP